MMARAKAGELGPGCHLVSSDRMVHVARLGSSGGLPDAGAVRTNYYSNQSAKSLVKDFSEHNPPTHLDVTHQKPSFSADQMITFAKALGLEVSVASFGIMEDLLSKANLIGRGEGGEISRSVFSSRPDTSVGDGVASHFLYS